MADDNNNSSGLEVFRVEHDGDVIRLCVLTITWPEPHTPVSCWLTATELPVTSTAEEVVLAIRSVLTNPKYFSQCKTCGHWNPNGWMHGDELCQSCASDHHGVVY